MDYTGTDYTIPKNEFYGQMSVNNFDVIFCQNCGAVNHIILDWCGSIKGLMFCVECGQEIG